MKKTHQLIVMIAINLGLDLNSFEEVDVEEAIEKLLQVHYIELVDGDYELTSLGHNVFDITLTTFKNAPILFNNCEN